VIVTPDMQVAESCARTIELRDGTVVEDIRRRLVEGDSQNGETRRVS